ncbi:MAG: response regulator [Propionicimonas sp.]
MSADTARIMVYSDDRTVRAQVREALGQTLAGRKLELVDIATGPAAVNAMDTSEFDLLILDGEAVPYGGMGLCHQLKTEFEDCPPVLLLVARVADAWLATWSEAEAMAPYPLDPVALPGQVATLLSVKEAAQA